jgi:2-polyprenyl-6-methoxyphenol hydroxylase-like FAD-dependent oxidoreductase
LPAELYTSSKVASVNASNATVTLLDGRTFQGDLVLGSDGVRSVTRKAISDIKPHGSGKSAFRFLISRKAAQDDPVTAKFVQKAGELIIWYASDRRVVVYPTTDNTLLNFVCIHPDTESDAGSDTWNGLGSREKLLKVYENFDPSLLALLRKADDELKVWKLMDMETLPTWVNHRLALLGDAAHPFLPHQGQGGGVAIEDAASLAVVLPGDTPINEIPARLQLYEQIRRERAHRIQDFSRIAGSDLRADVKFDSMYSSQHFRLQMLMRQCVNTQFTIVDLTSGIIQLNHYGNGLGLETHRYIGGMIPKFTNYHRTLVDFEI